MLIFNKSGSIPLFCIFYSTCLCSRNRNKSIIFTSGSFHLNIVATSWYIYSKYHTAIVVVSSLCVIQQLSVFISNIEFCYTIFNYLIALFPYFNTVYIYLSWWHSCCFRNKSPPSISLIKWCFAIYSSNIYSSVFTFFCKIKIHFPIIFIFICIYCTY